MHETDNANMDNANICPLAHSLTILGDRWSLLVLRDVIEGKHRYGEFSESREGIPSNILASRLRKLVGEGLLKKVAYQERPTRYEYRLTKKGAELLPVLQAFARWGDKYYEVCYAVPDAFLKLTPDQLPIETDE